MNMSDFQADAVAANNLPAVRDTEVSDVYEATQAERDDPTANLLSSEEKPSAADARIFGTPGMSIGAGCWRTTPAYIE